VLCTGTLTVAARAGTGWGVPWLDRPGSYPVTVSSHPGRFGRNLPLLRPHTLEGPYSTLLSYRMGERQRVLAAFPAHDPSGTPEDTMPALWQELARRPVRFDLRTAAPGEPWTTFASLSLEAARTATPSSTVSYDPYAHCLPGLRPTGRLRALHG
jgi:hypothetical protein